MLIILHEGVAIIQTCKSTYKYDMIAIIVA